MSFLSADQLLAHAVGDYLLQSDWMAGEKANRSVAAAVHAMSYALPFLLLTGSPTALAFIAATHFLIDRWRLARYVCWATNFLQPKRSIAVKTCLDCGFDTLDQEVKTCPTCGPVSWCNWQFGHRWLRNAPWRFCKATGYPTTKPQFLAVWLLIIVDNVLHVLCNAIALRWLA